MAGIDNKNNTEVPQEEKRQKLDIPGGYDWLDTSSKKAFDTLKFDSKWKWEKYNEGDVQKAIGNTIDEWIAKNKLQSPEKEKAEAIKAQLLSDMGGKDVKWMIESFTTMRTQLMSTMATDSAKDAKWGIDVKTSQDSIAQWEKNLQNSFEEKWKNLAELFLLAQKKAQDKVKEWIGISKKANVQWSIESRWAGKEARDKITIWWPT